MTDQSYSFLLRHSVSRTIALAGALIGLSLWLSGCAYAPSNTDWRQTPKVFLQVCVPSKSSASAEIVYYRSTNTGVWTAQPIAKTEAGQDLFEGSYEDPTPFHTGFGVRVIHKDSTEPPRYFIFIMRSRVSSEWSPWLVPDQLESSFPAEVDKFKRFKRLDEAAVENAPRIRYRAEFLRHYEESRMSKQRYIGIPACT